MTCRPDGLPATSRRQQGNYLGLPPAAPEAHRNQRVKVTRNRPLPARAQLVMSAEVNLAQATDPKITMYTPNDNSPCSSSPVSIGMRRIESNASHQCEGRYGPMAANCGMLSATSLDTARIMMAAIAAIGCSVRLEMASPIAPSMAMAAVTKRTTNSRRSSPSDNGTVVPDSSVTGPTGNSATPMISADAATRRQATRANSTTATYLTLSSLARPAGTTSR